MNNLYGGAMSEYLPYGGFKWAKITKETVNRILNKKDNSLENYPENLHEDHSDFLMAPEKIKRRNVVTILSRNKRRK